MPSVSAYLDESADTDEPGAFLELGTNRLARDLFLLTAVYALFVVMFLAASVRVTADQSWQNEARLDRTKAATGGPLLALHLRKDGRIQVGPDLVDTPAAAAAAVRSLIARKPALRDARLILSTYRDTPSIRTADVVSALTDTGLDRGRFYIRFTDE
jgi:hypothetical protein